MINIVISQFSIYTLLVNVNMSMNFYSSTLFSINRFAFKFFIKWTSLIIIGLTISSTLFLFSKYIKTIAYLSIWCLFVLKSRSVIEVIIVRIEISFNWFSKNDSFERIMLASISKQNETISLFWDKLIFVVQYCHLQNSYFEFEFWFEFILKRIKEIKFAERSLKRTSAIVEKCFFD